MSLVKPQEEALSSTAQNVATYKRRAAETFVTALATPNSLEIYAAVYAMLWGAAAALAPAFFALPSLAGIADHMGDAAVWLGVWVALWGVVGLVAMSIDNRKLRARSAAMNAMFWWSLAGWLFFAGPTGTLPAVVVYLLAALAEAWVYVRISQRFDDLVRDIRTHRRGPERGRGNTSA